MLLHYFKKKENIEKTIAKKQYKTILEISNSILNKKNLFSEKNYNTSFELVSIFLIIFIKMNLSKKNNKNLKINENLMSFFISDLDESLREKGIGDMSIGKYVKSYVKKFYYRLKKFPTNQDIKHNSVFVQYLKEIKFNDKQNYEIISNEINLKYIELQNQQTDNF